MIESKICAVKEALEKLENKVITSKLIKDTIDLSTEY